MASRFGLVEDDRELAPAPEFIPCDVCGLWVAITDEDEDDDEEILCLVCANARAQRARKSA